LTAWSHLFRNHAARDAPPALPARVGHVVVRAGVNHDGRAALVEQGIRAVGERRGGIIALDSEAVRRVGILSAFSFVSISQ